MRTTTQSGRAETPPSQLLRLSAAQRLAIVLIAVAALWGGLHWALS
ncbi:MAG: hypothetical protein ACLPIC_02420 [Rhodoblastus sp.]